MPYILSDPKAIQFINDPLMCVPTLKVPEEVQLMSKGLSPKGVFLALRAPIFLSCNKRNACKKVAAKEIS